MCKFGAVEISSVLSFIFIHNYLYFPLKYIYHTKYFALPYFMDVVSTLFTESGIENIFHANSVQFNRWFKQYNLRR